MDYPTADSRGRARPGGEGFGDGHISLAPKRFSACFLDKILGGKNPSL